MNLNKVLLITAGLALFSIGINAEGKELTGTVTPILTTTLNVGGNGPYRGVISEVAKQGSIIFPDIYNLDGHIAKKGDTLVLLRSNFWKGEVLACQGKIDGLQGALIDAKDSYLRAKKLVKDRSISVEQFQMREGKYYDTIYKFKAAEDDLNQAKVALASHTVPTPYPAKVSKVFIPGGLCATIPSVVTIFQLDPIWVEIEIPRIDARKITNSTPVTIFPAGGEKPIGVIHGHGRLTAKGYQFAVHNQTLIQKTINVKGKIIPVVRHCHDVYPIYLNNNKVELSVPIFSIFKDEKGHFVWKAEHQKNLDPNKGIAKSFPVRKVYVEPGEAVQQMDGYIMYCILKQADNLSPFDLVVVDPPDNIKNGDYVSFVKTKFLLMPGDKVKVLIGNQGGNN